MHTQSSLGDFAGFLALPEALWAVALPFALWSAVMTYESWVGRYDAGLCAWWTALLGLTFATSHWRFTGAEASLYVAPWFALLCLVRAYRGLCAPPALCAALSFMQALCIDVTHAANQVWRGRLDPNSFLSGVGGAGWSDGLLVLPLALYAALQYPSGRERKKRGAEIGAS